MKYFIIVIVIVVVLVTGCLTTLQGGSQPVGGKGEITAEVVPEAPVNATTVDYNRSTVKGNEYLQTAVRRAATNATRITVTIPEKDVNETKNHLQKLPLHTMEEAESGEWGYYVRYEDETVRVTFAILD